MPADAPVRTHGECSRAFWAAHLHARKASAHTPALRALSSSHCACSSQRQGRQCSSATVFSPQKHSALFALIGPGLCRHVNHIRQAIGQSAQTCRPACAHFMPGRMRPFGHGGHGGLARWFCSLPLACCVWPGSSCLRSHVLPQHLPQLEQWQAHNARKAASHALHQQGRSALYAVAPSLAKRLARGNVGGNARLVQRVEPHF